MHNAIFNFEKNDYGNAPLLLGEAAGLTDSLNKPYPKIFDLYKKLKSLDWDELEFDFSSCKKEFKTCEPHVYDKMIKTIAWQWEADSEVSRSVSAIGANFTSDTHLWGLWQRIGDNEQTHALTYSEIVKNSFDDPNVVLQEVLSAQEARIRLKPLTDNLANAYTVSHKLALGLIDRKSDEAYEAAILFVVTLYILERIQFMASFAMTFSIAKSGMFMPIGKAIQKICQDEYEIHARADLEILRIELSTPRGQEMVGKLRPNIQQMADLTLNAEKDWCQYAFADDQELPGLDADKLFNFTLYCADEVYTVLGLDKSGYVFPEKNPLPFLKEWFNIGDVQSSPMEEKLGNYMLGMISRDLDESEVIDVDL